MHPPRVGAARFWLALRLDARHGVRATRRAGRRRGGVARLAFGWFSLRGLMLFGTAVLAVVVSAAFLGLIVSTAALRTASERRAHSELVLAAATGAEKLMLDLETGERGYVITGAADFLEPWSSARRTLPQSLTRLSAGVRDNPVEERLSRAIGRAVAAYIRGWSQPLIARVRRDQSGARRLTAGGEGRRQVEALRRQFATLIGVERALAVSRTVEADRSASRAEEFAFAGLTGSLLVIAFFAVVFARSIARPLERLRSAADRMAGGDLSVRIARRGARELAELADSFDGMARSLEDGRARLVDASGRAERANQAKSAFLSRMSHELRTPLNAIIGFGQLLGMDDLDRRQREHVEHILRAGRHLLELINDVLEISRIEAGELALAPEAVSLDEAVRDVLALLEPLAAQRDLCMTADLDGLGANGYVQADRHGFRQILLNLVANAIKYNRVGGSVDVSFARTDTGRVRTLIADTGPGMGPAQLARLFEPFDRLGAEHGKVEGTGLGLTLSKRLVEAMGGSIAVESQVGLGCAFTVELAVADPPSGGGVPADADLVAPEPLGRGDRRCHVLYIEDNLSNLTLVERILGRQPGVELVGAMQGRLGLELAREHVPELILLDLHLPDLPGEEVLRRLKADELTCAIPVVILSADAGKSQVERLLRLGALEYLTKPLDVGRFLEVIDASLSVGAGG
jgi:signal transduction histidine kinase/CheY-like chemotaxis protein